MTDWTDLVKKVYNENKHKHGYMFKNALKDAAKIYKKKPMSRKVKKSRKKRRS
uniref:Uncharacterized protein n=1 Tax=viral metagenome TaxID=1070528 RepID=A0A6C0H4R0_9ZZZZ